MSQTWQPITRAELDLLVAEQAAALGPSQKRLLDRTRVEPRQATIRRTESAGDESVWVVAELDGSVLYFDDVETGWNSSEVDAAGRILRPTGSQNQLRDVLGLDDVSDGQADRP